MLRDAAALSSLRRGHVILSTVNTREADIRQCAEMNQHFRSESKESTKANKDSLEVSKVSSWRVSRIHMIG
jgi:hypothetical protein